MFSETVCAPASAPVNSSIAIIRVSGPDSYRAACSIFSKSELIKNRYAAYGSIIDDGSLVDDVILVYYQGPASFTGEDMVEIFCHGNPLVVSRILRLLFKHGVRAAGAGEFSKRAFLNGRMDLTAAEAINSLINARSEWEISASLNQMHGSLKDAVHILREELVLLKADIEAGIDFSDQDIEFVSYENALEMVKSVEDSLADIRRRCGEGRRASHGLDVILAGRPNVGKSSLMNLILNEERALVSDIPGTTRDLIRETLQIAGIRINLTDTAGIGTPSDDVERMGIELTRRKLADASVVLMVIDASAGITKEDRLIIESISGKKSIFILNKIDLVGKGYAKSLSEETGYAFIPVCAKSGAGFAELEDALKAVISGEFVDYKNSFLADVRVLNILDSAIERMDGLVELFRRCELPEIIAFELDELVSMLSEVTGEITPEDVLGSIFSRFCIGK